MHWQVRAVGAALAGAVILLAACGGGGGSEPTPAPSRLPLTDPRTVPTAVPWDQPPPVRYLPGAPSEVGGEATPTPEGRGECGDRYVVRPGDTLSSIAARCGVSLQDILQANPEIEDPASIFPGQEIRIPR